MSTITDSFKLHSTEITIEENGTVAVHGPSSDHGYVLGENMCQVGIKFWKLKLESFNGNNWMLVGIVKGDIVPAGDVPHQLKGSYGWVLGGTGQVWVNGQPSIDDSLLNTCKQGDTVDLVLESSSS